MDLPFEIIGWIFFILTLVFIFGYKWFSKNPDALTAKYSTSLEVNYASPHLERNILDAFQQAGFKRAGFNSKENRFYAQTGFSFSSWGEYILVKFQAGNKLEFTSVCALPTQLIDWGKNRRNAKRFIQALQKETKPN